MNILFWAICLGRAQKGVLWCRCSRLSRSGSLISFDMDSSSLNFICSDVFGAFEFGDMPMKVVGEALLQIVK